MSEPSALSPSEMAAAKPQKLPPVARLFWLAAFLGAGVGGCVGIGGALAANGAPQEASAAAMGCLIAIVPYVVARAIEKLTR